MSKKRNPSKHFRRNKRYFSRYGLFDMKCDWIKKCHRCAHFLPGDRDMIWGDEYDMPDWCFKKDKPIKDIELPKRPKCFRRKVSR